MTIYPKHLTLIRHGESEQNIAKKRSSKGDHSLITPEYVARLNQDHRLTTKGIDQAVAAGDMLKQFDSCEFDNYFVSPYVRTLETAYHLGLVNAKWRRSRLLRERDNGIMDRMRYDQLLGKFGSDLEWLKNDPVYMRPPQGESMADLEVKQLLHLMLISQYGTDRRVLFVTHSRLMWTLKMMFEHLDESQVGGRSDESSDGPKLHNGQILQYERDEDSEVFTRVRSIVPGKPEFSHDWREIGESILSNQDLIDMVNQTPLLYVNKED